MGNQSPNERWIACPHLVYICIVFINTSYKRRYTTWRTERTKVHHRTKMLKVQATENGDRRHSLQATPSTLYLDTAQKGEQYELVQGKNCDTDMANAGT